MKKQFKLGKHEAVLILVKANKVMKKEKHYVNDAKTIEKLHKEMSSKLDDKGIGKFVVSDKDSIDGKEHQFTYSALEI